MARFDENIAEPPFVRGVRCGYCSDRVYVGDSVVRTYEGDVVHEDCWRDFCDMIYRDRRGYIDADGSIN